MEYFRWLVMNYTSPTPAMACLSTKIKDYLLFFRIEKQRLVKPSIYAKIRYNPPTRFHASDNFFSVHCVRLERQYMCVSDFTYAKSTQELLYTLFRSEIGLFSVAHSSVQMQAVRSVFETLQKNIVAGLRAGDATFEMSVNTENDDNVALAWRTDAKLFKQLYEGMAVLSDVDDASILRLRIYPLVGDVVLGNAALKAKTTELLQAHMTRYGQPVGNRIVGQLGAFKLEPLAQNIMPAVACATTLV